MLSKYDEQLNLVTARVTAIECMNEALKTLPSALCELVVKDLGMATELCNAGSEVDGLFQEGMFHPVDGEMQFVVKISYPVRGVEALAHTHQVRASVDNSKNVFSIELDGLDEEFNTSALSVPFSDVINVDALQRASTLISRAAARTVEQFVGT